MSIRYHLVEPGMILWQSKRQQAGNTTMRRTAWYPVRIIEIHETGCLVSWNCNAPRIMSRREVEKLYRKQPDKKDRA